MVWDTLTALSALRSDRPLDAAPGDQLQHHDNGHGLGLRQPDQHEHPGRRGLHRMTAAQQHATKAPGNVTSPTVRVWSSDAPYHALCHGALHGMSEPVPAIVPLLAGAIAAIGVALVVGWPGRPPLTDPALVDTALAVAVVAVLLVVRVAAAGRRRAVRARRTTAPRRPTPASHALPEPAPVPPSDLLAA